MQLRGDWMGSLIFEQLSDQPFGLTTCFVSNWVKKMKNRAETVKK